MRSGIDTGTPPIAGASGLGGVFQYSSIAAQSLTRGRHGSKLPFVNVAPTPCCTWFDRLHHGVVRLPEMLGGMLSGRAVTTADVSAN